MGWKKIEKKFQKTTYEMEVNGQRKEEYCIPDVALS